jgi:hypothetical protein
MKTITLILTSIAWVGLLVLASHLAEVNGSEDVSYWTGAASIVCSFVMGYFIIGKLTDNDNDKWNKTL